MRFRTPKSSYQITLIRDRPAGHAGAIPVPSREAASPVPMATVPCHAAAGRQGRLVPWAASAQAVQNAGPADAVLALLVLLLHLVSGTQAGQRRPGPCRAD